MSNAADLEVETGALLADAGAQNPHATEFRSDRSKGFVRAAVLSCTALALVGTVCAVGKPGSFRAFNSKALVSRSSLDNFGISSDQATGVKPVENMNDGNTCSDDEELDGTLCYRKCSLLTGVSNSKRKNAFACCISGCGDDIFGFLTWDTRSVFPCTGYDVSSNKAADGSFSCPHEPGACLQDEEQNWGECFEKCSILTDGKYPYRTAAATCCLKNPAEDPLACIDPFETVSGKEYDVGGGKGDGDKGTPAEPHYPDPALTETQPITTTIALATAPALALSAISLPPLPTTAVAAYSPYTTEAPVSTA